MRRRLCSGELTSDSREASTAFLAEMKETPAVEGEDVDLGRKSVHAGQWNSTPSARYSGDQRQQARLVVSLTKSKL